MCSVLCTYSVSSVMCIMCASPRFCVYVCAGVCVFMCYICDMCGVHVCIYIYICVCVCLCISLFMLGCVLCVCYMQLIMIHMSVYIIDVCVHILDLS